MPNQCSVSICRILAEHFFKVTTSYEANGEVTPNLSNGLWLWETLHTDIYLDWFLTLNMIVALKTVIEYSHIHTTTRIVPTQPLPQL
jgi:hypothetical protein